MYYVSQAEYSEADISYLRERSQGSVYINVLGEMLQGSDILIERGSSGKALAYADHLFVTYDQMPTEESYFKTNFNAVSYTELSIADVDEIMIDEYGNYSHGMQWIISGYWAWYNKVDNMLPLDYQAF